MDFQGANLSGADLIGADLQHATLDNANLSDSCLLGSKLCYASLSGADVTRAFVSGESIDHDSLYRQPPPWPPPDLIVSTDFRGANLTNAKLCEVDLRGTNLCGFHKSISERTPATLRGADMSRANLSGEDLRNQDLTEAVLCGADLSHTMLCYANLNCADLRDANLSMSIAVGAKMTNARLAGATVFGISAWDINTSGTDQSDLRINRGDSNTITVDDIKMAQFMYLLLENAELRNVIDSLTGKVVLILGRFTTARKKVLDALRRKLRDRNYVPIMFDVQVPSSKTTDETVNLLARMSRFIIADITEPRCIPQELRGIIPVSPSLVVQPLLAHEGGTEYGMFDFFGAYPWVMPTYVYRDEDHLIGSIEKAVLIPVEEKGRAARVSER